jgi:hypothetical protein
MIAEQNNAEYQPDETLLRKEPNVAREELLIMEVGTATQRTKGCCGIHSELGSAPWNTHA